MTEQLTDEMLCVQIATALSKAIFYCYAGSERWPHVLRGDVGELKPCAWHVSLDWCREIIAEIERRGLWGQFSSVIDHVSVRDAEDGWDWIDCVRNALLATPRQICEAFIKCVEGK